MKKGHPKYTFKPGKKYVCVEANYMAMAYKVGRDPAYEKYIFKPGTAYTVDSFGRLETEEGVIEISDSLYNAFVPYVTPQEREYREGLFEKIAIDAMQGMFSNAFLIEKMWTTFLDENHHVEVYNISDIVTSHAIAAAEMMVEKLREDKN